MDSTRSFFPKIWPGRCLKSRFFLSTREPDVLAICLFYTFLLLLTRRIELYEISTWLKPRVHELKGKKHDFWKKDADFRKLENLCRQEKNDCAKTRTGIGLKFWPSVCVLMYAMYTSFQRCTTIFAVSGTVNVAVIFTFAHCICTLSLMIDHANHLCKGVMLFSNP